MKEKRIVHEAVEDAKQLKELAVDAAMGKIIEGLTPSVRKLVEKQLRGKNEDIDRLNRARDGRGETEFEEAVDKGDEKMGDDKELDLEALVGMFPGLSETEDEEGLSEPDSDPCASAGGKKKGPELEDESFGGIPQLGEAEDEEGEEMSEAAKEDDEKVDEEIEISEADLKKVYEQALKAQQVAEVMVSKGFKDMTPAAEHPDRDANAGIVDVKKGESMWDQKGSLPPDRKDYSVKEIKQLVRQGMAENKALREQNGKLIEALKLTVKKLSETNLFNAKVLHVNKLFSAGKLTKEQKRTVVESLDRASTVSEVKKIALSLESSFKSSGVVSEGRKPSARAQGARTTGGSTQKVLSESADNGVSDQYSRWTALAGICK